MNKEVGRRGVKRRGKAGIKFSDGPFRVFALGYPGKSPCNLGPMALSGGNPEKNLLAIYRDNSHLPGPLVSLMLSTRPT